MASNGDAIITTDGLTRRFGEIVAVENLTLEVHPGEVFGLLGHNGAGKTTTVRLLNGVLAPDSGDARVLGFEPVGDGPEVRRQTGILTETPSLDERLTGRENLEIYAELYDVPRAQVSDRVAYLLELFELDKQADEKAGGYSKGMKQRLALGRALLHQPKILFLDEPTAGLDPVAARRVHEMITRLSHEEQRTVVLCTHNLAEAQKLCGRVAVLEHGRLVALGTPSELARKLGRSQRLEVEVEPEEVPAVLEALLYTPTTDGELLLAKMLSAWLPAVAIAWGGFVLYSIVANLAAWRVMNRIFFPNLMWVVLALWVAPAVAGVGLGTTVLISARAQGFQEAYQLGAVVVLPVLMLVVAQAAGVMYFSTWLVFLLGLLFWILAALLLWFGARTFRRAELAVRL